ncbi:MAG: biotin synthase BioB, partial [Actinobacteria bacterium]|nr:biotin synthase BioB [Actinomycetota bacterium]
MPSQALAVAEHALLVERRPLTRAEVMAVANEPLELVPDLVGLAHRVRLQYCGDTVELESLINAKSGACPEDCAFCSQSVKFDTGVDVYAFLDLGEV